MYQSNRIQFDVLRSIDTATFTGSYIPFGPPLAYPARILHIINASNEDATISFDNGLNPHVFVPADSFVLYDFGTNKGTSADALALPQGTAMAINGTAGTGTVYGMVAAAYTPTQTIPT